VKERKKKEQSIHSNNRASPTPDTIMTLQDGAEMTYSCWYWPKKPICLAAFSTCSWCTCSSTSTSVPSRHTLTYQWHWRSNQFSVFTYTL